jgi:hypothetical protein
MLLREGWRPEQIAGAIGWLVSENARGAHIFVRPHGEHRLALLDDLTLAAIFELKHSGFDPAVVVETSPTNFQAWLNHGKILSHDLSTYAAPNLARRFGGDLSSSDWRHFGRFAGFTNQKEKRRLPNGRPPFVKLRESSGRTYQKSEEFLAEITARVERKAAEQAQRKGAASAPSNLAIKRLGAFHVDPRYGGDLHRADLAWGIYAASRGFSEQQIRDEILYARDLSKKGRESRQLEYAERTATKAITIVMPRR